MTNLIESKTDAVCDLINSYDGAITLAYQGGDEDANEMVIDGVFYTVEIYIYADEYRLFTSDFLETYTAEERDEGKNHKTVKTIRGVKGYLKKYALDM